MAVAPTGAIYKALEFDGVSSRTYGVYITGEAVYNAPERDVEMITIPGRNGSFALDNGRFQNIEVSYPAGIFAETEADFRAAISDFRNFLCSRTGYVRLQDEYNPNEYRMAVYKSGLEVDPAMLKAGEFEITFDCKPQRWLTSGESAVSVTSGDTLTNPTLFESSPLLEVYGEGDIVVNGGNVSVTGNPYGMIQVAEPKRYTKATAFYIHIDDALLELGDSIILSGFKLVTELAVKSDYTVTEFKVRNVSTTNASGYVNGFNVTADFTPLTLTYGTPYDDRNLNQHRLGLTVTYIYGGQTITTLPDAEIEFVYDGATDIRVQVSAPAATPFTQSSWEISCSATMADSTKIIPFNPIYIDLDIGEAWTEESGEIRNANNAVALEANLPVLSSGANEITFDNTVTDLKVIPRWWKI